MFSMPTMIEELKLVVLVKYEFEYRENLILKCFLWNFWTIRILIKGGKTLTF